MPIHASHSSTRHLHRMPTQDRDYDLAIFESNPSGEHLQFCKEAKDRCVRFLRRKFLDFTCRDFNRVTTTHAVERHWLPVTSFHIALLYNKQFVYDILQELNQDEVQFVLTSLIDYKEFHVEDDSRQDLEIHAIGLDAAVDWTSHDYETKTFSFHLPLALTMCNGSEDLLKTMIEGGADVLQTDVDGNNVIHSLVELSIRHPQQALDMYHTLLEDLVADKISRQKLLLSANSSKLTPLDYASEKCLPEMIHAIMNTEGVYKFLIRHCGTHVHSLYEVTHDETTNEECGKSLLQSLSVATEKQLARLDDFHLLEKEPFATWFKVKEKSNLWHTRFWMSMWGFYVALYLSSIVWFGEVKRDLPKMYHVIMLTISYIFLLTEIKGLYVNYPYLKMIVGRIKKGLYPLTLASAYRVFQSIFILTVIATNNIHLFSEGCDAGSRLERILQVANIFCGFMSVMFFTQLSEAMGHYLTVIEKMLFNTLAFLSIWWVIFLAFATSFYLNNIDFTCPGNDSTLLFTSPTQQSFSSIYHSIYETFLLVLAVVAPKSWYFEDSNDPDLSVVLYILCLIVNTLVLLNLLIAIMNERVVEICRHKHSILKLNQLSIYLLIGDKRKSDQNFWKRWKFTENWTDTHKHFIRNNEKTKLYLHVVERTKEC
ncbi:hypothetical protein CAPTEDRAFT_191200 [Capitella teleta]|uniref:Uncharacterized protein n=1 Tax=Capitella teleta TaxID=283909 RepID=R7UAF1_CAPTE|nr:hypothetical protein CAPTEDRAFT_191200 [Capitella teleta]|eukprot:ELU02919.1 hypothetical protein CAPTEDRAFT_191200 [Capitella teleta]